MNIGWVSGMTSNAVVVGCGFFELTKSHLLLSPALEIDLKLLDLSKEYDYKNVYSNQIAHAD